MVQKEFFFRGTEEYHSRFVWQGWRKILEGSRNLHHRKISLLKQVLSVQMWPGTKLSHRESQTWMQTPLCNLTVANTE